MNSFQRGILLLAFLSILSVARGQETDRTEQYRLTLNLVAPLTTNIDANTLFGFFANPDQESKNYRLQWRQRPGSPPGGSNCPADCSPNTRITTTLPTSSSCARSPGSGCSSRTKLIWSC